ncbi:MAG: GTP-binding protein [Candidatus Delongbacteria bacterium]|nr:GTP-binding protein [Candidatus Delongbacteria bacterium]
MIKKKICMLGSFAVGKTSLVQRFVRSIFSEKYLTTIGVKIDHKTIHYGEEIIHLILWDIHGEDEFQKVQTSYLLGGGGCLLVIDGTRRYTVETALNLKRVVHQTVGEIPCLFLINKADIRAEWEIEEPDIQRIIHEGGPIIMTSAKTGEGVEDAFMQLTQMIIG